MSANGVHLVTGGLGYSGKYIVSNLLERGLPTRTITNSGHKPNPFGRRLEVRAMPFHNSAALTEALRGASVLYNTYWVRGRPLPASADRRRGPRPPRGLGGNRRRHSAMTVNRTFET